MNNFMIFGLLITLAVLVQSSPFGKTELKNRATHEEINHEKCGFGTHNHNNVIDSILDHGDELKEKDYEIDRIPSSNYAIEENYENIKKHILSFDHGHSTTFVDFDDQDFNDHNLIR